MGVPGVSSALTERVRVAPGSLRGAGARVALEGDAHHHLTRVLRARVGDRVELFDGEGQRAAATLVSMDARAAWATLDEAPSEGVGADAVRAVWLQGVPKGDKLDDIVRQATELGVARVVPVFTRRSVPQARGGRSDGRRVRLQRIAEEAARQCGRADVPAVDEAVSLADALGALAGDAGAGVKLVACPHTGGALGAALGDGEAVRARGVVVLVGPEGGLDPEEVAAALGAGFVPVSLGPRVLRTETVAPALLAVLSARCGDLREG